MDFLLQIWQYIKQQSISLLKREKEVDQMAMGKCTHGLCDEDGMNSWASHRLEVDIKVAN